MWQGYNFDFTSAAFDGGDLHEAQLVAGTVNFNGATFIGRTVNFAGASFSGCQEYAEGDREALKRCAGRLGATLLELKPYQARPLPA